MTTHDVIDFVVAHYGADPKGRRSVVITGENMTRCMYDSPDGRQCAFRIFVRDEDAKFVNEFRNEDDADPDASCLLSAAPSILLRPEVQHLAGQLAFWNAVQLLHDTCWFWDMLNGGLTLKGHEQVEYLKRTFPIT